MSPSLFPTIYPSLPPTLSPTKHPSKTPSQQPTAAPVAMDGGSGSIGVGGDTPSRPRGGRDTDATLLGVIGGVAGFLCLVLAGSGYWTSKYIREKNEAMLQLSRVNSGELASPTGEDDVPEPSMDDDVIAAPASPEASIAGAAPAVLSPVVFKSPKLAIAFADEGLGDYYGGGLEEGLGEGMLDNGHGRGDTLPMGMYGETQQVPSEMLDVEFAMSQIATESTADMIIDCEFEE